MDFYWWTAKELTAIAGLPGTVRGINKKATRESWPHRPRQGRGGGREYPLHALPLETQAHIVRHVLTDEQASILYNDIEHKNQLPLSTQYELHLRLTQKAIEKAKARPVKAEDPKTLAPDNPDWGLPSLIKRNGRYDTTSKIKIVDHARKIPPTWTRGHRAWVEHIATMYGINPATIYRWMKRTEDGGFDALQHRHRRYRPHRKWDDEAREYWIGMVLKREHRKITLKSLYEQFEKIAEERGWRHGTYESARLIINKLPAPLFAYRDGGVRGLDNALPPIRRRYEDLEPFEIIVGDQHRFDFWVCDDDDPAITFRPEGYIWQDLCTRNIYGFSIGKKYNAQMIGHALWVGLKTFGRFKCVYTDNGRPETSKYILDRKRDLTSLGMDHAYTKDDIEAPPGGGVLADLGAGQRLAIVRNAKAKMIESTFRTLEQILRDRGIPGYVHELGGNPEKNEIDDKEIARLAGSGRLLTLSEFLYELIQTLDYYNRDRNHRGLQDQVMRESGKRPPHMTPRLYLANRILEHGWRPTFLSERSLDLVFLTRTTRKVQHGRVQINYHLYEAEELVNLPNGTPVELRYDPMDMDRPVIVIHNGKYLCDATPVEFSSMVDSELTKKKIEEKRRLKNKFIEAWRRYTRPVEDIRKYSRKKLPTGESVQLRRKLPDNQAMEQASSSETTSSPIARMEEMAKARHEALIAKAQEAHEASRIRSDIETHLEMIDYKERELKLEKDKLRRLIPTCTERPDFFLSETDRYEWCKSAIIAGVTLSPDDQKFVDEYHATHPYTKDYLEIEQEQLAFERSKIEEKIASIQKEIDERRAIIERLKSQDMGKTSSTTPLEPQISQTQQEVTAR